MTENISVNLRGTPDRVNHNWLIDKEIRTATPIEAVAADDVLIGRPMT